MESEFPTNSRLKGNPAKEEPKKVEKVVVGQVERRKKPMTKRISETFLGGDPRGAMAFVVADVLVPAAKDMIADAVSQGVEKMIFGEARSSSRRTGIRPATVIQNTPYNRYGPSPVGSSTVVREALRPAMSRKARATHDFDEIILATRVEAEEVIDRLFDLVSRYNSATVSDLYDLLGISGDFTDAKWGWMDLRGAGVTRVRNGYLLDLPRPEPID